MLTVLRLSSSNWNCTVGVTTLTDNNCVGAVYPVAVAFTVTGVPVAVKSIPVILKYMVDCPAGIVTVAGTVTFVGSLLVKFTVTGVDTFTTWPLASTVMRVWNG